MDSANKHIGDCINKKISFVVKSGGLAPKCKNYEDICKTVEELCEFDEILDSFDYELTHNEFDEIYKRMDKNKINEYIKTVAWQKLLAKKIEQNTYAEDDATSAFYAASKLNDIIRKCHAVGIATNIACTSQPSEAINDFRDYLIYSHLLRKPTIYNFCYYNQADTIEDAETSLKENTCEVPDGELKGFLFLCGLDNIYFGNKPPYRFYVSHWCLSSRTQKGKKIPDQLYEDTQPQFAEQGKFIVKLFEKAGLYPRVTHPSGDKTTSFEIYLNDWNVRFDWLNSFDFQKGINMGWLSFDPNGYNFLF